MPTVAETVPGYEASALFGMGAPKNTPQEIIDKLNNEINAVLAEPEMKKRLIDMGGDPLIGTPEAFGAMIVAETEKWKKVIEGATIPKVESGSRTASPGPDQRHRLVALEQIEQAAQRLAALALQFRIVLHDPQRLVARLRDELAMHFGPRDAVAGQAALPDAQHVAFAAQF